MNYKVRRSLAGIVRQNVFSTAVYESGIVTIQTPESPARGPGLCPDRLAGGNHPLDRSDEMHHKWGRLLAEQLHFACVLLKSW